MPGDNTAGGRAPDRKGNPSYNPNSVFRDPRASRYTGPGDPRLGPAPLGGSDPRIGYVPQGLREGMTPPPWHIATESEAQDIAATDRAAEMQDMMRSRLIRELRQANDDAIYIDGRQVQKVTVTNPETGQSRQLLVLGGMPQDDTATLAQQFGIERMPNTDADSGGDGFRETIGLVGGQRDDPLTRDVVEPTYAPVGLTSGQVEQQRIAQQEKLDFYSLLNLDGVWGENGSSMTFLMNRGPKLDPNGELLTDVQRRNRQDIEAGPRGFYENRHENAPQKSVTNLMSLAQGVSWFRALSQKDPDLYNEIQDLLVKGNYMPAEAVKEGIFTPEAAEGFTRAAGTAALNYEAGLDEDLYTFLQRSAAAGEAAKKPSFEPVARQYVDPAELHETARAKAEQMLGRGLTDDEVAQFAARFRGLENAMYDSIDSAKRSGGAITYTDPSATGQADEFLRDPRYNTDRARGLINSYMPVIQSLMQVGPGYL